jgi:uncharacterized membrane protein YqiK
MQTSFIPKKPIVPEGEESGGGVSLFLLIGIIIFIVSLALAGGVWFYKGNLIQQIADNKEALVAARASFEEGTIDRLVELDERIKQSEILLKKHVAISPIFTLLEKNVLQNVRLKTMKFTYAPDNKIRIDLSGTARNYGVLSKQLEAFGSDNLRQFINQPVISDFSPTQDGSISFNFTALVDPSLVTYGATLNTATAN